MHYLREGQVAKRPHLDLPEGSFEEELGLLGFFGPVSHIYHKNPPTGWTSLAKAKFQWPLREAVEAESLRPQCFRNVLEASKGANFFSSYRCLFWNEDLEFGIQRFENNDSTFFRNADASELYFCHEGKLRLESTFGFLEVQSGDYVLIPKGVTYRWKVLEACYLLRIQSFGAPFNKPDTGLMGQQALFHQENLRPAKLEKFSAEKNSKVWVQTRGELHEIEYPFDVREVVGWCGTLYPFSLSVHDIAPAMSPIAHLPPSINTTFLNSDFVVCTFLPRPLEEPEGALKVPFFHSNIDYDEVIFYHEGDFFSRDHMEKAYVSLHPRGINHGPHPRALKNQSNARRTNEIAVMIDTRRELNVSNYARSIEEKDYWKSWQKK